MGLKKDFPLVSIITVVFNGGKTLEQTFQSVFNQTYKNIEYIVIDGGSTDETINIIKKYEKYINYWVSESDKGLYDAMNKGIRIANGELIGIINSDDWYSKGAIQKVVRSFVENNKKLIFHGDTFYVDENKTYLRKFNPSKLKLLYYGMTFSHPSTFIHKSIYEKNLYDLRFRTIADSHLLLGEFLSDPNIFCYLPVPLSYFRLGGNSAKVNFKESYKQGLKSRKILNFNFFELMLYRTIKIFVFLLKNLK